MRVDPIRVFVPLGASRYTAPLAPRSAPGHALMLVPNVAARSMKMGECYVLLQKEEAEEMLERKIEECEEKLGGIDEQVGELKDTMTELKVELYGRFGKSINLDE